MTTMGIIMVIFAVGFAALCGYLIYLSWEDAGRYYAELRQHCKDKHFFDNNFNQCYNMRTEPISP